jgi:hypothetical protein
VAVGLVDLVDAHPHEAGELEQGHPGRDRERRVCVTQRVTNNSRLTCKTAGKYQLTGQVSWAANATGYRYAGFRLNGGATYGTDTRMAVTTGSIETSQTTSTLLDLAVNDYVELIVLQNSGSALNVTTSDGGPGLMMGRVA